MKQAIKHKLMALLAMLLVLFAVILTQGCGTSQRECENAEDTATVAIIPDTQTIDTAGAGLGTNVPLDWTVRVAYPDDTPMPYACLNISGAFAVPNLAGSGFYQFQFYPSWVIPNTPVNSGFIAKTDKNGQFTFSTLLSAGTGTWSDTIYARSGTNVASATVEVK